MATTNPPAVQSSALPAAVASAAPDPVRPAGATTVPTAQTTAKPVQQRRIVSQHRETDRLALIGAAAAAASLTWLLFTQIAPFSGAVGWLVVGYVIFLGIYALLVSMDENKLAVRDRLAGAVIQSLAGLLLLILAFVIFYILVRGAPAMAHLNFYLEDLSSTGPLDPLTKGGVVHGIVGTLIEISIALMITVPLGLTCAVFLSEFPGAFARLVRTFVEAMTALPSIIAGLFIYTTWILSFGLNKGGFAAGLAISVMMLPITIRAADVVLRLVPGSLTEASLALGASRWRTVWYVTLPSARSGLATAVILGTARGIGETSPVLLTAGFGAGLNENPVKDPMVSLPLLAYSLRQFPQETMIARAFGAAAVLMALVLVLFLVARWLGGRGPGVLTPKQQRRRDLQSRTDAARIAARIAARLAARRQAILPPVPESRVDQVIDLTGPPSSSSSSVSPTPPQIGAHR
jgi:phosphate transport system permease protein